MYCLHQTDNSFKWNPGPVLALTNQYELSLSLMKLQMILAVLNAIYATALRSLKNSWNPMLSEWRSSRVRSKSIMKSNCWFNYFGEKRGRNLCIWNMNLISSNELMKVELQIFMFRSTKVSLETRKPYLEPGLTLLWVWQTTWMVHLMAWWAVISLTCMM